MLVFIRMGGGRGAKERNRSQQAVILLPKEHLAVSGDIYGYHILGVRKVRSSGIQFIESRDVVEGEQNIPP